MAAYLIAQVGVTDPQVWAAYRAAVLPCIEKFGGRQIVRQADVEVLEGAHDGRRIVMLEFADMEALRRFWHSPDYAEVRKLREGAADVDVVAVPGVE